MQYKLITLTALPSALATTSLRGPASQSTLYYQSSGLNLPPPDQRCLIQSSESCSDVTARDSKKCVWCPAPYDDENGGLCLSEFDVGKANEVMGSFPCEEYEVRLKEREQDEEEEVEEDAEEEEESLAVSLGVPDFSCFSQAWGGGDIDLCNASKATDGSSCQWCTVADELIEVGVCVSPTQASSADKFGLNCPSVKEEEEEEEKTNELALETVQDSLPDINCFKAAWIADNAEDACGQTSANDGSACVWCQTKGDAMGACVSGMEASFANGQFGLTCPNVDQEEIEEVEEKEEQVLEEEEEIEDELIDAV